MLARTNPRRLKQRSSSRRSASVSPARQQALTDYVHQRKWFKAEKWEDEIVEIHPRPRGRLRHLRRETHRYAACGFINQQSYWHRPS